MSGRNGGAIAEMNEALLDANLNLLQLQPISVEKRDGR